MNTLFNEPAVAVVEPVLLAGLITEHAGDIVERLNAEDVETAAGLVARFPLDRAIEVFDQPELARTDELIASMPVALAVQILTGMAADRASDLLRELPTPEAQSLLGRLDIETADALRSLMSYPPRSAGAIMTTEFVSMPANATVAATLRHIRDVEHNRETVYAIYLLEPVSKVLVQTVTLRRLITGEPEQAVLLLAQPRDPITVSPRTDREDVARLISRHDLLAVPVVDDRRRVLGIVTVDDVIDAIIAESTEDVQKFGGVEATAEPYLEIGFAEMIRKRAGWLSALFLSEMLTASAMQHFADELQRAVVLTLFIPLIMSSGGNSGSQATSLLIRAMALGQLKLKDWWRVALREIPTGLTLGAILGVVGVGRITIWQMLGIYDYGVHWRLIALTVGLGLVGIVTFGSLSGSMLPFVLKRLGFDPASASAPFVATLVDVTGLVIYFSVAYAVLRGTLL